MLFLMFLKTFQNNSIKILKKDHFLLGKANFQQSLVNILMV